MDRRVTESDILELENKLLHPTAEPISLPLGFLESITSNFSKEQEIGSGGYGVVYKGTLRCGSVVAVKKFRDGHLQNDGRFLNEASFLMGIKHQNLVQLLAFCAESRGAMMMKQPNGKCIVVEELTRILCFEYMCKQGLDKHLSDESSGLEWNTRYKIIKGICRGLNFLHERKIVHLDLKPQNILMDATMVPKIADFGLSRLLGEEKSYTITITSNRAGTRGYMAPEYIDRGIISNKADIFSLGVIIIEILKGCRDDYPDYRHSTEKDFQHFTEKVLNDWRNRFERASEYTALELHAQLVKQCIDIALKCVHPDKEKRPNVSDIIEILNAAEGSWYDQNGEDLPINHQMGAQEGVLQPDVLRDDDLMALHKISMKDHAPTWITKDVMKSAIAPLEPQHEPVFEGSLAALCYRGARNASFWVAHKALASLEDNVLKDWAATVNLGPSVEALKRELLSIKAILESTLGKEIHNLTLEDILMVLRELVYDAEDVLDEMEYFRIQDMLDARLHAKGCSHTCDTEYMLDDMGYFRTQDILGLNIQFPWSDVPTICEYEQTKLKFRENASKRMQQTVEQMQLMQQRIYGIITALGSDWSTAPNIAQSRPITISESNEPKLYGRELMMKSIIYDITKGKHSAEVLTVIPIVGPGGIGKTTLAQHIYNSGEVQGHFDVRTWACVSLNFNVNKLIEEIQRFIPKVDGESTNSTPGELIRQRLKNKRLLLVLDDIWDCSDGDEWKQLLVPFKRSQVRGNIIIVTTRFPAQAKIMVQTKDHSIHLEGLESKEFDELFLEIVFGDDDQCRENHTFLLEMGRKIAGRLKGSPLAAITVGRLLRTQLDLVHWTRVFESKEWEQSNGKNDIMPALKLSFDYLPSQLQQCFSMCALFPQDYKFKSEEIINFWIGQEVLHSSHGENKRVEDIGLSHLTQLVNYGFLLENKGGNDGRTCYIIHDLLHVLARKVSSLECLSIDSSQSQVSSLKVMPSICHLSINIDDTTVKDRLSLKKYVEDLNKLDTRLELKKLRTLMIFGEHHGCFVKTFSDLFREAKGLRVIFLSNVSYDVEYLLCNFYNLLHLRYLHIKSSPRYLVEFPNKISRFYHMMVLDATHCANITKLPRDMSNLVKLRHFLVRDDAIHSKIVEVGKLKSLQELRRFVVKREAQGFDLKEIGHLSDLCGSLRIDNLQNVQAKEEADEANLLSKGRLHELILHWDNIDQSSTLDEHVLENLRPSSNLQKLSIKGHWGTTCPLWLHTNLSIKSLESLCLEGIAWKKFPPIGELCLVNVPREELSTNIPKERFGHLRWLELCKLTMVEKWVVHASCQLFPFLEVLIIKHCPQLVELSFNHSACCEQGKEVNVNLFPRLLELVIINCPQLVSFPPVPWNEAPCSINIKGTGSSCLGELVCEKTHNSEYGLTIEGKNDTNDSTFWNVLDFRNLTGLKVLSLHRCQPMPLRYIQMMSFLRKLEMSYLSNTFPFIEANSHVKYQSSVEELVIIEWNARGKELTQLLVCFPKLSKLRLLECKKVTGLAVNVRGHHATETPGPSSPANKEEQQQGASAEDDMIVAPEEEEEHGLLLLPPQLQELRIRECPVLSLLRSNRHDDNNKEDGRTGEGGGLQGLTSLRRLGIYYCPEILCSYSSLSFSSSLPFPNSLEHLKIHGAVGTGAPVSLSNLTSLTSLSLYVCGDLRGEGLLTLLALGHLTELSVGETPNFIVDSEHSQVHEQDIQSCSSKLQKLDTDDVAGFTTASIHHSLIFSSLTNLSIYRDNKVERFTEEQEALLFVNSLEEITFSDCSNLQSLPDRLHRLDSLKRLHIMYCGAIKMLPKDCLPSSLQELKINYCLEIQSLPCLPDSLQKLEITNCPAIRSLPEVDDLPSSLRELDVREESWRGSSNKNSEELRSQCRRFINIIPIVRT